MTRSGPRSGRRRAGHSADAAAAAAARAEFGALDPNVALTFPLAGLLAEPPGTSRTFEVDVSGIDAGDDIQLAQPVSGNLHVARTNRGVLLDADLRTALATECSRCLRPIEVPLELAIDEEVLPSVELASGAPVDAADEPDVARLNDHHELELLPLVIDAILLAEPIAPVCRPDCPGLCATCGEPLDMGVHDHPDETDPRLAVLAAFRPVDDDDVPAEDGAPEARAEAEPRHRPDD